MKAKKDALSAGRRKTLKKKIKVKTFRGLRKVRCANCCNCGGCSDLLRKSQTCPSSLVPRNGTAGSNGKSSNRK